MIDRRIGVHHACSSIDPEAAIGYRSGLIETGWGLYLYDVATAIAYCPYCGRHLEELSALDPWAYSS